MRCAPRASHCVAVVAIAGLLNVTVPAGALEHVAHALDGDTIVMLNGERVRLENVDTPELHCRCILECRQAQAARAFTQEVTASGVTLQRQQTRAGQPRTDR